MSGEIKLISTHIMYKMKNETSDKKLQLFALKHDVFSKIRFWYSFI